MQRRRTTTSPVNEETIKKNHLLTRKMAPMALSDSELNFKKGLASVKEQLVFYIKNEVIFFDKIAVLKRDVSFKDLDISWLKRFFYPSKIDLSNSGLEEFQEPEFEGYGPKTSKSASEDISNEVRKSNDASLVEKLVSDDKSEKKLSQKPRGNQRNWNNQKSQQLGNDFVMHNKACYVCGSFDHLQYTCKQKRQLNGQREEKPGNPETELEDSVRLNSPEDKKRSSKSLCFEGYGPKTSKSASEDISNEVRKSNDAPLIEKLVSDDKSEKKIVFPTVTKIEFVKSKQQEKLVRKPVKYAEMYRATQKQNWKIQRNYQEESFTYKEEMAPMALSDSEVKTCSKTCLKNHETLKKQYDDLRTEFNKSEFNLANYKRGLASVEKRLVYYKKNEVMFCEKIDVLKRDITYKDSDISVLKCELEKLKKEKESTKLKLDKFENASKSLDKLIGSQISDNSRKGVGFVSYNDVPPLPTGYEPKTSKSVSEVEPKKVRKNDGAPIIEDWVSDDEEQDESKPKYEKKVVIPTVKKIEFVRPKQQEKPVKYAKMYRSQGPRGNQRN
ncbi:hypothetical protein Tco_1394542 [Tanacetum coccineum]